MRTYLDFVLPCNWKELSLTVRKAWFQDESVRSAHYKMHTHDGDFVRDEMNAYDFCMEYLGMESSNSKYLSACNKIHRFMQDIPGWVRLDGMHRNNGCRARITYERIAKQMPPADDKRTEVEVPIEQYPF